MQAFNAASATLFKNSLTVKQLKAKLEQRSIAFPKSAKKQDLLALLTNAEKDDDSAAPVSSQAAAPSHAEQSGTGTRVSKRKRVASSKVSSKVPV